MRALHSQRKQLTMMLDVLIDRTLDELSLLEARHQRRVADLLLGGLMNLDRGALQVGFDVDFPLLPATLRTGEVVAP
jgi:hypothetical protein